MPGLGPAQESADSVAARGARGAAAPAARWRWPLAVVLIMLASVVTFAASLTFWVRRQVLDTERWTAASSRLLSDAEVRHAVAIYLVDTAIANAGPGPNAPPARDRAVAAADRILREPAAQRTWQEVNRLAHGTLLAVIDEDRGRNEAGDAGLALLVVSATLLVVRQVAGDYVVDALAGRTRDARRGALSAWLIASTLLRDGAIGIVVIGALAAAGGWLAGRSRPAGTVRRRLAMSSRGPRTG